MDVRLHSIVALFLEFVRADLIHQSDAAALLVHIDDDTLAFRLNHLHGFLELLAALAALGTEDVSGHAGRVHAAEHRFVLCPCAFGQHHVL